MKLRIVEDKGMFTLVEITDAGGYRIIGTNPCKEGFEDIIKEVNKCPSCGGRGGEYSPSGYEDMEFTRCSKCKGKGEIYG
jgi:hypothetical protein